MGATFLKKYFVIIFLFLLILELVWSMVGYGAVALVFKSILLPLLAYRYYELRYRKINLIDKILLLSFLVAYVGIILGYKSPFKSEETHIIVVSILYLTEGQMQIFILEKLATNNKESFSKDVINLVLAVSGAVGYLAFVFPPFLQGISFIFFIRMFQLAIMSYYTIFRENIPISLQISIILLILSNMIWGLGYFNTKILPYHYSWGLVNIYLSKLLFAESFLKNPKMITFFEDNKKK